MQDTDIRNLERLILKTSVMIRWGILSLLVIAKALAMEGETEVVENRQINPDDCLQPINSTVVPVECCPTNPPECKKYPIGGKCTLNWPFVTQHCDAKIEGVCDQPWCTCCVDCEANKISLCKKKNGKCRRICGSAEYKVNFRCHSKYCSCCKECRPSDECKNGTLPGFCVSDKRDCSARHYISDTAKCRGKGCKCCKPCVTLPECSADGGYCQRRGLDCDPGFVASECGCEGEDCICCKPVCDRDGQSECSMSDGICKIDCGGKEFPDPQTPCNHQDCRCCKECKPTDECREGPNPGFCVSNASLCSLGHYISSQHRCEGEGCQCCERCIPMKECQVAGGYCQRGNVDCRKGFVPKQGACMGEDCMCCVPETQDECLPLDGCSLSSDFCSPTGCPPPFAQLANGCQSTTGRPCFCCKSLSYICDPQDECITARGYCTTETCDDGYFSSTGCRSPDMNCKCCKPIMVIEELIAPQ